MLPAKSWIDPHSVAAQLVIGASLAAVSVGVRELLVPWSADYAPFALNFVAVLGACVLSGWFAGLSAVIVGQGLAWLLVLGPRWHTGEWLVAMFIATLSQLLLVAIISVYQRQIEKAAIERDRQLAIRARFVAELQHRVKNTLAVVQAIAHQTFTQGAGPRQIKVFQERLRALATAHDLLTRRNWTDAGLAEILNLSLGPFRAKRSRIKLNGPDAYMSPNAAVHTLLIFHELATNALKYGALSNGSGSVQVRWTNSPLEGFRLEWREQGGPPVKAPTRRGFGTRVIERGAAAQLGAKIDLNFAEPGLICTIAAPEALCATPAQQMQHS